MQKADFQARSLERICNRSAPAICNEPRHCGGSDYVSPEERIPADHPLRPLSKMVDTVFKRLSPLFDTLYAEAGRPSIAAEKLLRALAGPD